MKDRQFSDHDVPNCDDVITNNFSSTEQPPAIAPKSWVETRYVKRNGKAYGPYRLRRWYEGGRLRSRYLGKATKPE